MCANGRPPESPHHELSPLPRPLTATCVRCQTFAPMAHGASTTPRILLAALVLASGCAKPMRPQASVIQQIEHLAVRFTEEGEFMVIDERAHQDGPLGFGLLGLV